MSTEETIYGATAFVGAAGTGKTYHLVQSLLAYASEREWKDEEQVLALTFMHGARRRLEDRLRLVREAGYHVTCETIDSFVLRIIRKFRRYLLKDGKISIRDSNDPLVGWKEVNGTWLVDFETAREEAADLLKNGAVQSCFRASYPVVMIDELQDCDEGLLEVVKSIADVVRTFVAADPFQKLDDTEYCPAVEWLTSNTDPELLERARRTSVTALIRTAESIRIGKRLPGRLTAQAFQAPGLAAWEIATKIAWRGWGQDVVILTPTSPHSSSFMCNVLASLTRQLGKKRLIGPFPFAWETSSTEAIQGALQDLERSLDHARFDHGQLRSLSVSAGNPYRAVYRKAYGLSKLRGNLPIERSEILELAQSTLRAHSVYSISTSCRTRRAMTIHAAKNQEFQSVFVIWPYQVPSGELLQRKLLYNAVTRAKENLLLLVQGDGSRIAHDPVLNLVGG